MLPPRRSWNPWRAFRAWWNGIGVDVRVDTLGIVITGTDATRLDVSWERADEFDEWLQRQPDDEPMLIHGKVGVTMFAAKHVAKIKTEFAKLRRAHARSYHPTDTEGLL
jgi:hypothetical protein